MADRRALRALRIAVGLLVVGVATAAASGTAAADGDPALIRRVRLLPPDHLRVELARPIERIVPENFRLAEERAPDVPLEITAAEQLPDGAVLLTVATRLDRATSYRFEIIDPAAGRPLRPSPWALVLTVVLSAALINNFVFTRYLGLCVFFGVSKKRETAIGMGVTFTAIMILSAVLSWALYTWIMKPLGLQFLQILVFIGVVAFLVQMLDTVLKKMHRALHSKFGIYLVLITTNCIILAVPLLNASADSGPLESLGLAVGSGVGFALALFLMSCARERVELARVPDSFRGLPIAFALTGLFALAFMGFSGLDLLR